MWKKGFLSNFEARFERMIDMIFSAFLSKASNDGTGQKGTPPLFPLSGS
jgi:hypothetical protein